MKGWTPPHFCMEPITKDSASSVSFSPGNATLGVWRRRRGKGARAACGRAEQLFCPLSVVGPAAGTGPPFLPRSLSPPLTPRGPPRTRIHIQVCDNVDVRPLKSALKSGRGSTPTASLPATPTRRRAGTPPAPPGAFSAAVAADATQPRYYVRRSGAGARKRDPALAALGRVLAAAGVVEAGRGGAGATTSAAALGASAVPDAAPAHAFILACSACGKGEVDSLVSKAGVRATVFRCVWWTGGAGGGASLFHACGDPSSPSPSPFHPSLPPKMHTQHARRRLHARRPGRRRRGRHPPLHPGPALHHYRPRRLRPRRGRPGRVVRGGRAPPRAPPAPPPRGRRRRRRPLLPPPHHPLCRH